MKLLYKINLLCIDTCTTKGFALNHVKYYPAKSLQIYIFWVKRHTQKMWKALFTLYTINTSYKNKYRHENMPMWFLPA